MTAGVAKRALRKDQMVKKCVPVSFLGARGSTHTCRHLDHLAEIRRIQRLFDQGLVPGWAATDAICNRPLGALVKAAAGTVTQRLWPPVRLQQVARQFVQVARSQTNEGIAMLHRHAHARHIQFSAGQQVP